MRSTILSHHQYDTKFVATAKRKPTTMPWAPPRASPMKSSSALSVPSNNAVFIVLDITEAFSWRLSALGCRPRAVTGDLHDQPRDERRPIGQRIDINVFVERVGAVADRAEAVERRHAERSGEIPVRPSAGAAFAEFLAKLSRDLTGLIVKTRHMRGPFQRRALEPALGPNARPGIPRLQRLECALDLGRVAGGRHADVDEGARFVGNDVRAETARDDRHVDGDAAREILECVDRENLMRELVNGARALLRLDARARRAAFHNPFAPPASP